MAELASARPLSAIVLAAGHGTRMRSERPKPLHVLVGKPMVVWVLDALADCAVGRVSVVVGHGADEVTKRLVEDAGDRPLEFVEQAVQRGTGDAAMVGLTGLADDEYDEPQDVLVLTADTRRCCAPRPWRPWWRTTARPTARARC